MRLRDSNGPRPTETNALPTRYANVREVRREQKALIEFMCSDLYERVPTTGNTATDGDWVGVNGWRVRLTRPDLAGGPLRIDATIFDPDGVRIHYIEDAYVEALDGVLP